MSLNFTSNGRELRFYQPLGRGKVRKVLIDRKDDSSIRPANISRSGMFLEAPSQQFYPGQNFEFDLQIAGIENPVRGVAKVQWVREKSAGESLPQGVGVKVVDFFDDSHVYLERYLENQILDITASEMMDGVLFDGARLSELPTLDHTTSLLEVCSFFANSKSQVVAIRDQEKMIGTLTAQKVFAYFTEYIRVHGKRNREQMERSCSKVAHELRSPLATIYTAAEILGYGLQETNQSKSHKIVEIIKNNAMSARELIERILDLSAIAKETERGDFQSVDLQKMIQECLQSFQLRFAQKEISLSFDAPASKIYARSNPEQIRQILHNLLSNALKFCRKNNRVRVYCAWEDGFHIIHIHDNGPGIPLSEQSKLFEEFNHLSNRPTAGEKSSGLGLAISQNIAKRLGGEIGFESAPGFGSDFFLKLPMNQGKARIR